jgi:uncharacterized RDD family membrane protein YckC
MKKFSLRLPRHNNFHVAHIGRLHELDGLRLAKFRTRAIAFLIDGLTIFFILVVIRAIMDNSLTFSNHTLELKLTINTEESFLDAVIVLVYYTVSYYLFNGYTLGKRIMRLRVISVKSERMGLWQAIERSLGYGASALEAGFGFIQVLWYENRQAVHDRIAETVVIKLGKKNKKAHK